MALLGSLQVRLGLDTGVFSNQLTKFSRDAKGVTAGINKGFLGMIPTKAIVSGLAGIASGLSAISFARAIQGANDLTDSLRDASIRLGIGVSDLQSFQLAAGNAGIESQQLTGLLGKLNKTAGQIKLGEGNEKTVEAFRRLGISISDVRSSNPADLFRQVITGLGGIADPAARAAASMAIFGKSGQTALTLVADGAGSLADSKRLLDQLGLSLSQIDADNVDAANDALGTLGFVATAAKQKLGAELAPVISDIAGRFLQAGTQAGGMGQQIQQAANSFGILVNSALLLGNSLSATFNLIQAGFAAIGAVVTGFAADFVKAIGTTAPAAFNTLLIVAETGLSTLQQGFADFATSAANLVIGAMNTAATAIEGLVARAAENLNTLITLANVVTGSEIPTVGAPGKLGRLPTLNRLPVDPVDLSGLQLPTFGGDLAQGLGDTSTGLGNEGRRQIADFRTDIVQASDAFDALFDGSVLPPKPLGDLPADLQEATTYADQLTGAIAGGGSSGGSSSPTGGVAGALEKAADAGRKTSEQLKLTGLEIGNVWTDTMQSIGGAIDSFVQTGKLSFRDLGESILQTLASAAIKNAINNLFGLLTSSVGGATTGGTNWIGTVLSLFGSSGASFEGGGYTGAGPRSGGLDGRGGRLAMLHPNETVIDHERVRGTARESRRGRGVNLSVPITLMPGVSKQELAEILPLLKRDIIETIPRIIARGGRGAAAYGQ